MTKNETAVMEDICREKREIKDALEGSVKLQSHYALLLNMHDSGQRRTFVNADAWIARLRELK